MHLSVPNPDAVNHHYVPISVVIPTCNRKMRLLSLLKSLALSSYPLSEIIIVDAGEDKLTMTDIQRFGDLVVKYVETEKSVCIQRNTGINIARSSWIFLCDDDIELPSDYIEKLMQHISIYSEAGAVSGLILQQVKGEWSFKYSIKSTTLLLWKYIFQLSIWGDIDCRKNSWIIKRITRKYEKKGNHISKAGWPVITDFSGNYFTSPLYGLGASLIRKDWLILSPYDEVLDRHGIGDNFGVAAGFPSKIHILTSTFAYHFEEPVNRLNKPLQYYRRVLALDYFRKTRGNLPIKKVWLLWSLFGNLLSFVLSKNKLLVLASLKAAMQITFGKNPYYSGPKHPHKIIEPLI